LDFFDGCRKPGRPTAVKSWFHPRIRCYSRSVGFRLPCVAGKVCALSALSALRGAVDGFRDFGPGKSEKKCAKRAVSAISHRFWFRWSQPATTPPGHVFLKKAR
jgi:hypothetical protein